MDQHKAPPRPPNSDKVNPEPFQPFLLAWEEPKETTEPLVPEPPNCPVGVIADDSERIPAPIDSSQSTNTKRSYDSAWGSFEGWCFERSLTALPADTGTICDYLADCSTRGLRIATIRSARAAIGDRHRRSHGSDPTATSEVRVVLSDLSRHDQRPQHRARPLTAEDMEAVRATACIPRQTSGPSPRHESPEAAERRGRMDIAILSLLRDPLIGRSELAELQWGDIECLPDGSGRITVRKWKAGRDGEYQVRFISSDTVEDVEYIRPHGMTVDFDARVIDLTPGQIGRRVGKAAQVAGLGDGYSGHSGRVGMAQDLAASGTSMQAVMVAGRWKSERMPALYTRRKTDDQEAVAEYYKRQSMRSKLPRVAEDLREHTQPQGKGARSE